MKVNEIYVVFNTVLGEIDTVHSDIVFARRRAEKCNLNIALAGRRPINHYYRPMNLVEAISTIKIEAAHSVQYE